MYHAASGATATAAGTLAYTGSDFNIWVALAAFTLIGAGLAFKRALPKLRRQKQN